MKTVTCFDPDAIHIGLAKNIPAALREIADAIDAKALDARLISCRGNGLVNWRDPRAHILVTLDLAAEVRRIETTPDVKELGQ